MDGVHHNGFCRFGRQAKPRVLSRSDRMKSTDDIHNWIKKVEEASSKATDAAFGLVPSGRRRGKAAVEFSTGLVRNHEQAYTEAQELLTQWVNEKVRFDVEDGFDDLEAWRRAREAKLNQGSTQKVDDNNDDFSLVRLTRLALEDDFEIDEAAIYERVKRNAIGDADPYADLYKMEDRDAVDVVLQNMLTKEVVKETFKKDLGFNDDYIRSDPRTKMDLRHNIVKENREKRQKQEEKKKMETQMKKEARLKAQQLIQKEQKDRESRTRKEEMILKKEMTKIRKEMHEERTQKAEELRRRREEKALMDRLAREELEQQIASEEKDTVEVQRLESDKRKQQMIKMETLKAKVASRNLQCLHRHLTAWYDLVLSKRLLMGKIKAMSDWKLMLKVWGAWRSHVRGLRLELETEIHERNIIDGERKKHAAERYYTNSVLRRCFSAWWEFISNLIEKKELEKEQEKTKSKMMSLLNAVTEGRMWNHEAAADNIMQNTNSSRKTTVNTELSHRSTDSQKVQQMFQQPIRKQAWVDDESFQSSRSEISVNRIDSASDCKSPSQHISKGTPLPTEPWQVNRRHLKLTKTDILNLHDRRGQNDGCLQELQHTDAEIRKKFGTQPWMKKHFVVNNLEHRYTAQQQTLREQQTQIREQKRLIEDLQFGQRQQTLRQHLLLGSDGPLLSPVTECEVPPPGKQIPRGDKDDLEPKADQKKNGDKCNGIVKTLSDVTPDVTDTNGSELSTSRTEESTVTSATRTSFSAAAKTHNPRYLKVLKNIEERAVQRAQLKAVREERKRIQEEEKLAQLQKVEEETKRVIEAEKKAKIEAYRQKKLLEKQKEIEKQRQVSHFEELNKMADEHYKRSVLKYRGLLPFKKIISLAKRNWMVAVKHRDQEVLRKCLRSWRQFSEEAANEKKRMADQMHQFLITKHSFQKWKNYKHHMKFLMQRAERNHQDILRYRTFHAWVQWVTLEREETLNQMEMARLHYLQSLNRKIFLSWRHLPEQMKREEERQKRKMELRQKVAELIPDFSPRVSVTVKGSEDLS